jgi:predicted RNase H-like nuclease (RuvC/YqgF family)
LNEQLSAVKHLNTQKENEKIELSTELEYLKVQNEDQTKIIVTNVKDLEAKEYSIIYLIDESEEQSKQLEQKNNTIQHLNQHLSTSKSKISSLNSSLEELKITIQEKDNEIEKLANVADETLKTFAANEQSIL